MTLNAKTILFDLGGVLVHLDWDNVCAPLAELSDKTDAAVRQEVVNGPIVRQAMTGQIGSDEFRRSLCAKLGFELPHHRFTEIWTGLLSANAGIVSVVEGLRPRHRLILASNTDPLHFTYCLDHYGVLSLFDRNFLSYEMGLLKPDPSFFEYILRSLQVDGGDCIFVDDRLENVLAARGVGIIGLQFMDDDSLRAALSEILGQ
jgi:HAD superfamily hydrolase (TIGR01509 family)